MKALVCVAVLASAALARDAWACAGDADCKGDRICEEGKCVAPKPSKPKPKKAPVEEETEETESKPPPASSAEVEPASSPWRGAKAPVKLAVTLVAGDSSRANDNVFYGTGFGLQVGYVNSAGLYVGAYWHEHLRNERSESKVDPILGRVQSTVNGRSSYYLIELGAHTNVASWMNLRWTSGLGLGHYTGEAHVYFPDTAIAPASQSVDKWGFVLQTKLGVLFRPSPGWYLGPQFGFTMVAIDSDFGMGAYEAQAVVGWVF